MRKITASALLALALAACSGAADQTDDSIRVENDLSAETAARPGPAPAETRGQEFVSTVLGAFDFALAGARIELQKGGRDDVKRVAQAIVRDLDAASAELKRIAAAGNLAATGQAAPTHSSDLAILSSTSGPPVDRAFVEQQMPALTELVGLMRAYKNGGDNPALQRWAESAQATVNDRLMEVQEARAVLLEEEDQAGGAGAR